jgi:acyl carrier protein
MAVPSDETLLQDINQIFQEFNENESLQVTPDFARENEPQWDSMTHLNIMMGLEMKYGIKFSVVEIEAVQNVAQLMALVRKKLSGS